jgi:predicted enzyme related to lactoylglutathione lyase
VFGWEAADQQVGEAVYTSWRVGGRDVGGMSHMTAQWPDEVPAHWLVYFAVEDCDAAVARCGELGGQVTVQPTDVPVGRFAALSDPQGAHFAVIARGV